MNRNIIYYPLVSRLIAAILIIAGVLKSYDLWIIIGASPLFLLPNTLLAAFDLLLGSWLLFGFYPRWTRIATIVTFVIFLNITLRGALANQASCGCFGAQVEVRPWLAAALDLCVICGLLVCAPKHDSPLSPSKLQWVTTVSCGLVIAVIVSWPFFASVRSDDVAREKGSDLVTPIEINSVAYARAIDGLESNYNRIQDLTYATDTTTIAHPVNVKLAAKVTRGQVPPTAAEQVYQILAQYYIHGNNIRCDSNCTVSPETDDDTETARETLVGLEGVRIQFVPGLKRAWLERSKTADDGREEPIDLRCAGFRPPIQSIASWLKTCDTTTVAVEKHPDTNDETVRVEAIAPGPGKAQSRVLAYFVSTLNYMPSRVVYYYHPNGGIHKVTDIKYQKLNVSGAWFPRTINSRYFFRNTTNDPNETVGQNVTSKCEVVSVVEEAVDKNLFDPILPSKTRLSGDLAREHHIGSNAARIMDYKRDKPIEITPITSPPSPPFTHLNWSIIGCLDVFLLGLCYAFKRRFRF